MMNLDEYTRFAEFDPNDMLGRIGELPTQCREAWALIQNTELPPVDVPIQRVIILGMGGSAIGGALVQGLVRGTCEVPVSIRRGYTLPAFAQGSDTLVVGCSYSGNTEETLASFGHALERGTRTVAITTGGKLAALARRAGHPVIQFDYPSQPRAALGHSFTLLLGLFSRLGLVRDYSADLEVAIQEMEDWQVDIDPQTPIEQNQAKMLASRLVDRLPVVYGSGFLAAVANRWKTQLNENSKQWAFFEELPELHHNSVVGLGIPEKVRDEVLVLMLRSPFDHPRVKVRWDVTLELLQREGVAAQTISGRGKNRLAQLLSLIHLGDYVSYYLAMLNGVDPTPVESISFLKRRLAEADRIP